MRRITPSAFPKATADRSANSPCALYSLLLSAARIGRRFAGHDRAEHDRIKFAQPVPPLRVIDRGFVRARRARRPLDRVDIGAAPDGYDQRGLAALVGAARHPAATRHRDEPVPIAE